MAGYKHGPKGKAGARAAGARLHRLYREGLVSRKEGGEGRYYLWSLKPEGARCLAALPAPTPGP